MKWEDYTPEEKAELIAKAKRIMQRAEDIAEAERIGDKERLKELGVKYIKVNLDEPKD